MRRQPPLSLPAQEVAPDLLGWMLSSHSPDGVVTLQLTEVEAYAGLDDPASHAFRGRTPRNAVMFGPAGHAYVHRSHGLHWCLNVVTGPDGVASAVLLRAGADCSRPPGGGDAGPGRRMALVGRRRPHGLGLSPIPAGPPGGFGWLG